MNNYQDIENNNIHIKVLDGHLVDVQGTLVDNKGKLNKALYKAMLEAQQNGENIYIYSSFSSISLLKQVGIDTEKFHLINKSYFRADAYSEAFCTLVTGKVIDDNPPHNIITTDKEHGFVYPNKEHYSFVRTNVPENLIPHVRQSAQKDLRISLRREGQSVPPSKEEQRQKRFEKEERAVRRNKAEKAFEEELKKNPESRKRVRDFEKPLTKEEQARIHLEIRKKEYWEKKNETSASKSKISSPQIWLSPAETLKMLNTKISVAPSKER